MFPIALACVDGDRGTVAVVCCWSRTLHWVMAPPHHEYIVYSIRFGVKHITK